ncbi:MAG: hypothetical protein JO001_23120 [Alphaproteobacteria bacterium]|nr:hypothetical protein [Alphaproteobacteria bacterium]
MPETIILGDRRFETRPLTLGQLRPVLDALDAMAGQSGGSLIEAAARIVAAGLAPAYPELTVDRVLDLEASVAELNDAVAAVLDLAGLRPVGEPAAVAANGSAPNSAPSTPPSPPDAAMPTATLTA